MIYMLITGSETRPGRAVARGQAVKISAAIPGNPGISNVRAAAKPAEKTSSLPP